MHYSKKPAYKNLEFWVQVEQFLIFWGIFSNNRLIRFYSDQVIIVIAFGELQ